jgi:hypothetical protein
MAETANGIATSMTTSLWFAQNDPVLSRHLLQTILAVQAAQNSAGYDLVISRKGVTGDCGRRREPDGRADFRLDTSTSKVRKLLDESLERLHGALPPTDLTVLTAHLSLGIPARRSRPASGAQRQPSSDYHQQAPTWA